MPTPRYEALETLLDDCSGPLPAVTHRRMFGCHALFANESVYALVWKTGRIGLKFPDPQVREQLLSLPGAEPWRAGNKTMKEWVLLPENYHEDPELLCSWVQRAHAVALSASDE